MIVGAGVAVAMSRSLTALLFAVSPLDALTYAGVAALLLIATSAGTIVPAWRAARIAPAVALQSH
jgi:putative ABC transport system permease protein